MSWAGKPKPQWSNGCVRCHLIQWVMASYCKSQVFSLPRDQRIHTTTRQYETRSFTRAHHEISETFIVLHAFIVLVLAAWNTSDQFRSSSATVFVCMSFSRFLLSQRVPNSGSQVQYAFRVFCRFCFSTCLLHAAWVIPECVLGKKWMRYGHFYQRISRIVQPPPNFIPSLRPLVRSALWPVAHPGRFLGESFGRRFGCRSAWAPCKSPRLTCCLGRPGWCLCRLAADLIKSSLVCLAERRHGVSHSSMPALPAIRCWAILGVQVKSPHLA